jgi:hypothetical protein
VEGLRKNTNNLSLDREYPGRDSKQIPSNKKVGKVTACTNTIRIFALGMREVLPPRLIYAFEICLQLISLGMRPPQNLGPSEQEGRRTGRQGATFVVRMGEIIRGHITEQAVVPVLPPRYVNISEILKMEWHSS